MTIANFRHTYCDAITYQQVLDRDSRTPPEFLRERGEPDLGDAPIPTAHFTSKAFFERQIDKMWMKTWQMACREEDIPNVGDFHVYDIVGRSLIVVRTAPDQIKALHNSCLHRGRKLVSHDGCKDVFRCQFHGFAWRNDGTFVENPLAWDFPHLSDEALRLPEARVGTWGGFVFVNFDRAAASLESVLGVIPRHFETWAPEKRYTSAHLSRRVKCNWLAVSEAFMEPFHAVTTHPQMLPFVMDANAQYDVFSDHVTRHITARGISSPFAASEAYTEEQILAKLLATGGAANVLSGAEGARVPEGSTARIVAADNMREALERSTGYDYANVSDAEISDSLVYNLFPSFTIWGGLAPVQCFRWLPDGKAHDSTIFEVRVLQRVPKGGVRPPSARHRRLADDEPWTNAPELGGLAAVLEQDWGNLPYIQEGLEASETGLVQLARYSEMRIRQQHLTLDAYMNDKY